MIRDATDADLSLLQELWREFDAELPLPLHHDDDASDDLQEIEDALRDGVALVAEEDDEPVGFATADLRGSRYGVLSNLYVRRQARRGGVARELVRGVVERLRAQGAEVIELEVLMGNAEARTVYEGWGFEPWLVHLVADATVLEERLAARPSGPTFGSVHVQTDDRAAVERTAAKIVPRLGRSGGTEVSSARNGWIAVYDQLCDGDPKLLQRLARELSYTTGVPTLALGVERGAVVRYSLYDRGGVVDEYLSVPEYYGPLPPGDVVALGANPTVVARLTGADPARVREVMRTAATPAELPPAEELLAQVAATMGIEGAERGWIQS